MSTRIDTSGHKDLGPGTYFSIPDDPEHRQVIAASRGLRRFCYLPAREHTGAILISGSAAQSLSKIKRGDAEALKQLLRGCQLQELGAAEQQQLLRRLSYTDLYWFDPPPSRQVLHEIALWLKAKPNLSVTYVGRGVGRGVEGSTPTDGVAGEIGLANQSFFADEPGGLRGLLWRSCEGAEQPRPVPLGEKYPHFTEWCREPDSQLVLSMGSGGFKLAALPALLHLLDVMNVRANINEVWGCSAGAIIGYLYSLGLTGAQIERNLWNLYYDARKVSKLRRYVVLRFLQSALQVLHISRFRKRGVLNLRKIFAQILRTGLRQESKTENSLPFFCTATDFSKGELAALTAPANIGPGTETLLTEAAPLSAVVASSSAPILFEPTFVVSQGREARYGDGVILEEVPLLYPYLKWSSAPAKQRKKLKILFVDLNTTPALDLKETPFLLPHSHDLFVMTARSPHRNLCRVLPTIPGVEVHGFSLDLRVSSFPRYEEIPRMVFDARQQFVAQLAQINATIASGGMGTHE